MKNDMKLIMEDWRSKSLLMETNSPGTVGDFRVAMYAASDPNINIDDIKNDAEKYMKLYEKVNGVRPTRNKLKVGLGILGLIAGGLALAPLAGTSAAIAATIGTSAGLASLASAGVQFIADLIDTSQEKKIQNKDSIRKIMAALGIDSRLLAAIEDSLEDDFFKDVIAPELENYFKGPHDAPIPNLTVKFQEYLNTNTKSPLSKTDAASKVAPKT